MAAIITAVTGLVGIPSASIGTKAPVALGLVLAPMLELSLRQSLAMSAGSYGIFVERPIAATMLGLGVVLLLLSLKSIVFKGKDWRNEVGLEKQ